MLMRSYARTDTAKGVVRKFAILTCQRVVGRSSEAAFITFHGLKWDSHFQHVFLEWPQSKSSKLKLGALGAGADRHSCWFLAFGDYLVWQPDRVVYSEEDTAWLLPALQQTGSPGTTLGNYIRAMLPKERGGCWRTG